MDYGCGPSTYCVAIGSCHNRGCFGELPVACLLTRHSLDDLVVTFLGSMGKGVRKSRKEGSCASCDCFI